MDSGSGTQQVGLLRGSNQRSPLHRAGNLVSREIEQRRHHIQQVGPCVFPVQRRVRRRQDKHPKLCVIAGIGASVVFFQMKSPMADATDRAPVQPSEMHDQVRRDVADVSVNFLRFEN